MQYVSQDNDIKILRSIYFKGYEFPGWVTMNRIKPYLRSTIVYCSDVANIADVLNLMTQREPVNISQSRYYSQNRLINAFGWGVGYYQRYWDTNNSLCPNIGVYCRTPVYVNRQYIGDAHIFNAIGYAMDNIRQPDVKYYNLLPVDIGTKFLRKFYSELFNMIYTCARHKNFSKVIMSAVGAGNFAMLYPGGPDKFQKDIWIPQFEKQYKRHGVTTFFMGSKGTHILKHVNERFGIIDIGYFPALMNVIDTSSALIVNAWDPFSIIGNGNNLDDSLDGHIGRVTACSMICWPIINKEIKYATVKDASL